MDLRKRLGSTRPGRPAGPLALDPGMAIVDMPLECIGILGVDESMRHPRQVGTGVPQHAEGK
jgi:hypothetical protein